MSDTRRLLDVTDALTEAGLRYLIMGGHAVRYYGIDRKTVDFDFHLSLDDAGGLESKLKRTKFFSGRQLDPVPVWRGQDFQRFKIGVLPNDKEEYLEFWFRNHLLSPFPEMYSRREIGEVEGKRVFFMALEDLMRSKETERDDDWADLRLLEEIFDSRPRTGHRCPVADFRARSFAFAARI